VTIIVIVAETHRNRSAVIKCGAAVKLAQASGTIEAHGYFALRAYLSAKRKLFILVGMRLIWRKAFDVFGASEQDS